MSLPNYIASRTDWDAEQQEQLKAAFRGDAEGFQRAWERRYPTSVQGAIAELRSRGLSITDDNFARWCDLASLQRIGRSYLLYADDIDRLAETMVEANKITGLALRRKNDGISYAEEIEAMQHVLYTRRVRVAQILHVTIDQLIAAIRVGGVHDPAHKQIDMDEARAWFAQNEENPEYVRELELQEAL